MSSSLPANLFKFSIVSILSLLVVFIFMYFNDETSYLNSKNFKSFTSSNESNENVLSNHNHVHESPSHIRLERLTLNLTKRNNRLNYTLRNPTWEQMSSYIFFKRSAAFYIIEKSLLRLFFVSQLYAVNNLTFAIKLKIYQDDGLYTYINIKNGSITNHQRWDWYEFNSLNFNFSLLDYLEFDSYDDILKSGLKFDLFIRDADKPDHKTWYPIEVRLKYIRSRPGHTKKRSIVCSKCFYYDPDKPTDLFWWVELNKQIGYKKIVFCNNSIPNTNEFNDLFERNKDFIELNQLHHLPNFIDNHNKNLSVTSHDYLPHFLNLTVNKQFYPLLCDIFDVLHTNECFLNNTSEYDHITVIDNDEVIIPRVNSKIARVKDNFKLISDLKFDEKAQTVSSEVTNLASTCSKDIENQYDDYLKGIKNQSVNFHFMMGFYLKDRTVKKIINRFEEYFSSPDFNPDKEQHTIIVVNLEPTSKDHNAYNFTFIINNKEEISYAKNLCKLYRLFVEKFENENKNELSKYSLRYHRFFYIGGLTTSFACGKTSHSTDVTFSLTVHYPDAAELHMVQYDEGQLSHFRHVNQFPVKNISITELVLDLNYLNCFYKPIVNKYSKINLY